jgi:site-specific recombinase XerD
MKIGSWFKKLAAGIKNGFKRRKTPRKSKPKKIQNESLQKVPELPVLNSAPRGLQAAAEFSESQLSPHTAKAYRKDLEDWFIWLKRHGLLEHWSVSVTPVQVSQYRNELIRDRGLAKGTVTRKLAVLKSFYRWALARNWVDDNPADLVKGFPQTQESKTGFLNDHEIDSLLSKATERDQGGLTSALERTVIETLLMLGLRRAEVAAITLGDIEFLDGQWLVKVHGKGDRERRLPLPPRLLATWERWFRRAFDECPARSLGTTPRDWILWLRAHKNEPLLFSSRAKLIVNLQNPNHLSPRKAISSSEIARIVRKMGRRSGLVNRISPHMLRATAITHALDHGASHRGVQQMAGWTSPLMITRYDKRRKDPKHSAVHHLKYATVSSEPFSRETSSDRLDS